MIMSITRESTREYFEKVKTASLGIEEKNGLYDIDTIEYLPGEDPIEKYMSRRKAASKSPMLNRPMPKSVVYHE